MEYGKIAAFVEEHPQVRLGAAERIKQGTRTASGRPPILRHGRKEGQGGGQPGSEKASSGYLVK